MTVNLDTQWSHFSFSERYGFGTRTNKSGNTSGISDNIPYIVIHNHVNQNISWKHFFLHGLFHTVFHFHNTLHRNLYFQNLVLQMPILNCFLNVLLDLIFISRISMNYVPVCLCHKSPMPPIISPGHPHRI